MPTIRDHIRAMRLSRAAHKASVRPCWHIPLGAYGSYYIRKPWVKNA